MIVRHGSCGLFWWQSGNRTSHCAACHLTFDNLSAFDRHRRHGKCLDPIDATDKHGQVLFDPRHGKHDEDRDVLYWRLRSDPAPAWWLDTTEEREDNEGTTEGDGLHAGGVEPTG